MIVLRNGDRLPTVAVLQSYLNQQPSTRPLLALDGAFGPKTRAAVRQFQAAARLTPNGVVDWEVWKRVVGSEWQIVDWVDHSTPASETDDLKPYAQTLLESFGMSRGARRSSRASRRPAARARSCSSGFTATGVPGIWAWPEALA